MKYANIPTIIPTAIICHLFTFKIASENRPNVIFNAKNGFSDCKTNGNGKGVYPSPPPQPFLRKDR